MMLANRQTLGASICIFILGLILFSVGCSKNEIISFESRFYLFALEMWRHGPSWFATTYHTPYPDYPGTSIFLIYLTSQLLGEVSRLAAVFPTIVVSALTLMVTYLIGARHSQVWGWGGVGFLLLTYSFVAESRTISLDQYTTLITALCFYAAMDKKLMWIFPLLVLGFAIRGPIGLVVPTGVLCVYYLLDRDFKTVLMISLVGGGLFVLCGLILLGLAYDQGGMVFVHHVIKMQVVGRLQEQVALPWNFYFTESLVAYALVYPLAILMIFGLHKIPSPDKQFLLKLLGWILVVMVGLSIPTNKKIRYILPAAPALALMCGYLCVVAKNYRYYYYLQRSVYYLCLFLPTACLLILSILLKLHTELMLPVFILNSIFIALQLAMLMVYMKFPFKPICVLMLASLCFVCVYVGVIESIHLQLNRTRVFVQQAEAMRASESAMLGFYKASPDGLVIKYLAQMSNDDQPVFIKNENALLNEHRKIFFGTSEENFHELPIAVRNKITIMHQGKIGREPFVVFKTEVT